MATFNKKAIVLSGAGLAAAGSATLIALALDGDTVVNEAEAVRDTGVSVAQAEPSESADSAQQEPAAINNNSTRRAVSIDFSRGGVDDLRDLQLTELLSKLESVPGVSDDTKVWIASADVASTPGSETLYHIKGPLTCGSAGCDLIVAGGSQILLETVGESVDAPAIDTLIINQGTSSETVWEFNGDRFVRK
ncbi:hypothetical protein PUV54_03145 [Hyphococcus flavus]|uniref:Uncharacterized protein n=1 Tax=Hyphococcus flavus TaxID=1866326 RepID=A0AAF0CHR0_9PROT|nr:hypothetical protein [Hyphococcus flavus]WDI32187.1 hypothetical protein PUV54_03145 [Hyphococcus flavus]